MKRDTSLKTDKDKQLWNFLQTGVFSDLKDSCTDFRKQGYSKKQIVDYYRPTYEKINNLFNK
jgi:hypothetical protein